jgi:6-phosphogluconolactonase
LSNFEWIEGDDECALADTLARDITDHINDAVSKRGRAVVAFSGGSTPKPMFQALCRCEIDWSAVIITLVDERWVPETHALSNAAFLHQYLLSAIPTAKFIPLYAAAETVKDSLPKVLENYCSETSSPLALPAKFDVVVLGMGGDGHTASFFPDAENIQELVDPHVTQPLLSCESESTQVPRVTWSLPMLLDANFLALHFTGATKRAVFEQAVNGVPATKLPIASVIHAPRGSKLPVYYAE